MKVQTELGTGLISAIHEARRRCLERRATTADATTLSEEEEVDLVLSTLSRLDRLDCSNDLWLARQLKQAFLQNIPFPSVLGSGRSGAEPSLDDNVVFGLQSSKRRNSLEAVRRLMLREIQASIVSEEMLDESDTNCSKWLDWQALSESQGNKKQKSSGYFSFNFDDIPLFEPLEVTLSMIRQPFPAASRGFAKLLELDMGELVEHPQWPELVELMFKQLLTADGDSRVDVVLAHVRMVRGLQGKQSIEIAANIIKFCRRRWMRIDQHTSGINNDDNIVAAFVDVLNTSLPQLQFCDPKSSDTFIATLFCILARAKVSGQTILNLLGIRSALLILDLARSRPVAIALHAIQSHLLGTVLIRSRGMMAEAFRMLPSALADVQHTIVSGVLLTFGLLLPLVNMTSLKDSISSCTLDSEYTWAGDQAIISGDLEELISLVPIPVTNKMLSQYPSVNSLLFRLKVDDAYDSPHSSVVILLKECLPLFKILAQDEICLSTDCIRGLQELVGIFLIHSLHADIYTRFDLLDELLVAVQFSASTLLPSFIRGLAEATLDFREVCDARGFTLLLNIWTRTTNSALQSGLMASDAVVDRLLVAWTRLVASFDRPELRDVDIASNASLVDVLYRLAAYSAEVCKLRCAPFSLQFLAALKTDTLLRDWGGLR